MDKTDWMDQETRPTCMLWLIVGVFCLFVAFPASLFLDLYDCAMALWRKVAGDELQDRG